MNTSDDSLETVLITYKISKLDGTEDAFIKECHKHHISDQIVGTLILCENKKQMTAIMDDINLDKKFHPTLIAYRREMSVQAYVRAYSLQLPPKPTCNKKICIEGVTC